MGRKVFFLILTLWVGLFCCKSYYEKNLIPAEKFSEIRLNSSLLKPAFILGKKINQGNEFNSPTALAVDKNGRIYVSERENHKVHVFSREGEYLHYVECFYPEDIVVDGSGNLYVLEIIPEKKSGYVKKWSNDGTFLNMEVQVPFDSKQIVCWEGCIFVSSCVVLPGRIWEYNIYKISQDGTNLTNVRKVVGEEPNRLRRTAQNETLFCLDRNGNLIVAYRFLPKVEIFNLQGECISYFEYRPEIKNKKKPIVLVLLEKKITYVEKTEEGEKGFGEFVYGDKEYPVCLDVICDGEGNILLLVARNHNKEEACDLYTFDISGKLLAKVELPIPCKKIYKDFYQRFYFLSPSVAKAVFVYERVKKGMDVAPEKSKEQKESLKLSHILRELADYCERLENTSLDFVCLESIEEKIYYPSRDGTYRFFHKNTYLYDYQLVRKNNTVQEKRILLEENGEKKHVEGALLKTKIIDYRYVLFGPIGLLSRGWQSFHDYRLIGKTIHNGKKAYILEVIPKPTQKFDHLYGKVWMGVEKFNILNIEWVQESLGNYKLIKQKAEDLRARPNIICNSEYEYEKNGIMFPSRYSVKEIYLGRRGERYILSEMQVRYRDYKFFTVETQVIYK